MEDDALLEMFRMEISQQIGFIGPFIIKKQLQNLGKTEETFTRADAHALIKSVIYVVNALFGRDRAALVEKRLVTILSTTSDLRRPEPINIKFNLGGIK